MKTEFERLSNRLPMEMLSMKRYLKKICYLNYYIFFLFLKL